jgi:serine/threonine-protein kinase
MDLYGFGALLYEALTDRHAFNPRLPQADLAVAIELLPPTPPLRLDSRVPPGLNDLTLRLLAKKPEQRPQSAHAVREELMRMLETEGNTEAWTVPYAFGSKPRADEEPVPPREERKEEAPPPAGQTEGTWKSPKWRRYGGVALLVLALGWVLLGVGWRAARAGCTYAVETACSGALNPYEGLHPMSAFSRADDTSLQSMPPRTASGLCALLCTCAATAQLAACASAPVRPDMGPILEQCPAEARATARRLGLQPIMQVELESFTCAGPGGTGHCLAVNAKSGPVEGMMILNDEEALKVTGEAKVFPDRVYISFDRVYPTPEGPPVPLCGVALNDGMVRFGVTTAAAMPPESRQGLIVDPALVDRSKDAAVLAFPIVFTYIQGPEGSFKPRG